MKQLSLLNFATRKRARSDEDSGRGPILVAAKPVKSEPATEIKSARVETAAGAFGGKAYPQPTQCLAQLQLDVGQRRTFECAQCGMVYGAAPEDRRAHDLFCKRRRRDSARFEAPSRHSMKDVCDELSVSWNALVRSIQTAQGTAVARTLGAEFFRPRRVVPAGAAPLSGVESGIDRQRFVFIPYASSFLRLADVLDGDDYESDAESDGVGCGSKANRVVELSSPCGGPTTHVEPISSSAALAADVERAMHVTGLRLPICGGNPVGSLLLGLDADDCFRCAVSDSEANTDHKTNDRAVRVASIVVCQLNDSRKAFEATRALCEIEAAWARAQANGIGARHHEAKPNLQLRDLDLFGSLISPDAAKAMKKQLDGGGAVANARRDQVDTIAACVCALQRHCVEGYVLRTGDISIGSGCSLSQGLAACELAAEVARSLKWPGALRMHHQRSTYHEEPQDTECSASSVRDKSEPEPAPAAPQ